jgi:CO/xanthine dehydrogenase Mo-binding subunit
VLNAVFNAIGVRFRKLPVRPEDVLRALGAKGDA